MQHRPEPNLPARNCCEKRLAFVEEVAHFLAFRFEVTAPGFVGLGDARHAFDDLDSCFFERFHLVRIVRHQADASDAEVPQNRPRERIIPQIAFEAELLIGFDRIGALILQLIGSEFVHEPDTAALLLLVNDQSAAFTGNLFESDFELGAAIATKAVKDVAGQTLGMDPQQRGLTAAHIAHFEDSGLLESITRSAFEAVDAEEPVFGRKMRFGRVRNFKTC